MLNADPPPAVLDDRTPMEFDGELVHIPGARLMPVQVIADRFDALAELENRDIIVACRTGNRSTRALQLEDEAGFRKVYNFQGGMRTWNEKGGPVE